MEKSSLIFCAASLGLSLLVAILALPFVSLSNDALARAKSVVSAEEVGSLDLGDFGTVEVSELATYYAENPPVVAAGGARKVRFEGC